MALKDFSFTPQSEPLPNTNQQMNNAGGYSFVLDEWKRLERFLILGTDGGTYYVQERALTMQNALIVKKCATLDPKRTLKMLADISIEGRAPKNDPALFALAILSAVAPQTLKDFDITSVIRTGTHLFNFVGYVENQGLRRWGRSLRTLISKWYAQTPRNLAYQAVKYRQRNGWTHKDVLRLAHTAPTNDEFQFIYRWITKGSQAVEGNPLYVGSVLEYFDRLQAVTSEKDVISLLEASNLPWECVPTQHLKSPDVWNSLLRKIPLTALIRNLGRLTHLGLLEPDTSNEAYVVARLDDREYLHKSRIHPLAVLLALNTYESGKGFKGSLTWTANRLVAHALNAAFYKTFQNVIPTGKRIMLALDVSGSMASSMIAGTNITAREASGAMAMVTHAVEPNCSILLFSSESPRPLWGFHDQSDNGVTAYVPSKGSTLRDIERDISNLNFGATDCALPMLYALRHGMMIDAFVVYTDSETWSGQIHPHEALVQYRKVTGIPAKEIVVAMTATEFSVANPDDAGQLDVVGFDTSTPAVVSDFIGYSEQPAQIESSEDAEEVAEE